MAVVVDLEDLDLVVEPHTHTLEDRDAFRHAVLQHRQLADYARLAEEAALLIAQRTKRKRPDGESKRD